MNEKPDTPATPPTVGLGSSDLFGVLENHGQQMRWEKRERLADAIDATISAAKHTEELALLVKRLVREIRLVNRTDALAYVAMDYLVRHRLDGSPLRSSPNDKAQERRGQ